MMFKPKLLNFNADPMTINDNKKRNSNKQFFPVLSVQNSAQKNNGQRIRLREDLDNHFRPRTRSFLKSTDDPESFHCAISSILMLAQVFGLLPVTGIRSASPLNLRFVWSSIVAIHALCITIAILLMAAVSIVHMMKTFNTAAFEVHGGIAAATAGAVFYGNSFLGSILFFWLSPKWVILQQEWRMMESYIDSNKLERPKLRWKFMCIAYVILGLAVIEHVLSILNNSLNYDWKGTSTDMNFQNFLHVYSTKSHGFILDTVGYHYSLGIFLFIISKIATFTWNFTDVFVMLVATGLAERYKILNKKVMASMYGRRTNLDWCELREDYAALSNMVKRVDNYISPIILLSFGNNLYFICLQLLNGLSIADDSMVSSIYFFGSFIFLIGRTCAVTLLTARINDQSRLALPALYNCSSFTFNIETQRLQTQLSTDEIALTGLRFFSITRNFMLAVAGAIITYEVVLLQFNVAMNK